MAAGINAQLSESLTPGNIAGALFVFVISSFIVDFARKPRYTEALPRVGCGGGLVGTLKNFFFFVTRYNKWVSEGYEKACHIPSALSRLCQRLTR